MDFRIIELNDGIKATGMNEHGRYVELDLKGTETIQEVLQLLEESKTELEKENERIQKEKVQLEEDKQILANTNQELVQEKEELKSSIQSLIERYAAFVETKDEYEVGKLYMVGDTFKYKGIVYVVLQPHTSQADWKPDSTPALYKVLRQTEEAGTDAVIQEWVQPTGAHDAYMIGDKVLFNGKTYESIIDYNTWSPRDYPQGWKEITNG